MLSRDYVSDDDLSTGDRDSSDQIARNADLRKPILRASNKLRLVGVDARRSFCECDVHGAAVRENLLTSELWKVQII